MQKSLRSAIIIITATIFLILTLFTLGSLKPAGDLTVMASTLDESRLSISDEPAQSQTVRRALAPTGTYQDFDLPNTGTPYVTVTVPATSAKAQRLNGGPTDEGKFMRLAFRPPFTVPNENRLAFDLSDPGAFDQIVADFDFRMTSDNGRADGLGFALLNTANYGTTGPAVLIDSVEEPNFTNSLGVGFDIYQNVDLGETGNNHLSIHFNNLELGEFNISPSEIDLAGDQWIHARVIMRLMGGDADISVILTQCGRPPRTVIDRVPVPGFVPYEGRVHFAARSGGESADHDIDNVHVQFLNLAQSVLAFNNLCYSVIESAIDVVLTVVRTGIASGTVSVDYATSDGSAAAGSDYSAISGTLTFNDGEITKTINVPILNDGIVEGDEYFLVTLGNPTGGNDVVGGPARAKITIKGLTYQNFDQPNTGTPYITGTHIVSPSNPPRLISGGPTDKGKLLRLAFGEGGISQNSIAFTRTNISVYNQFVADFDFRITPGTGRADGFGFAFLNTANYGITGTVTPPNVAEEPGFINSLGIGFDIYRSGDITSGLELNDNHISVHYNDSPLGEYDVPPDLDLAGDQWIHARVIMRLMGGDADISVILTQCGRPPRTVIDRVPVPGFVPYEGRVHFAARSGGLTADFDFDNIRVQSLNPTDGVLSFNTGCYSVVETEGEVLLTVTRTGNTSGAVSVNYATSDGSAAAGSDYSAISGTLTFNDGEITKTISVPILDDSNDEGDEVFIVSLSNSNGDAVTGGPAMAKVRIVDDERASIEGSWSEVIPSEVIPIQAILLPTGKVMYWDREDLGRGWDPDPRLWDPATELITRTATVSYELFCSGHSFLADGSLFVTGGHHITDTIGEDEASIYNPYTDAWTLLPKMNAGRWYPSNVTLANGDVLVMGGSTFTNTGIYTPDGLNRLPQVWETANGQWRDLTGAEYDYVGDYYPHYANYYPFLFVAPDGRVFNAGPQQVARYLDTSGSGAWTDVASSSLEYRDYGSAVMYDVGKVLIVGGNPRPTETQIITPSASAEIINLNDLTPSWQLAGDMHFGRRHHNVTLLPDGTVLVTGGSSAPGFDNEAGAVLTAELWYPITMTWQMMAPQTLYRGYHSTALLLPDARVLVGGGGHPHPAGGPKYNFEVYSPPYLFKGSRPTITSAPTTVAYGQPFLVETPDATTIQHVNWIRLGAVTHAFNQNQRFNRLNFEKVSDGLKVTAPFDANLAPPGHYMLFILNDQGVPSVAHIIQVVSPAAYFPIISK